MGVMRVLVACEESQAVTIEMRELGIEAYSCDVQPCSGGHPEWHIQDDVLSVIRDNWDMLIGFPPCTHLAVSGARWFAEKRAYGRQRQALELFKALDKASIKRIALENPVSIVSSAYRRPDQIIQPWMFGHPEQKTTCLWLKNLSCLQPTQVVEGREQAVWKMAPSEERAKLRSRTYPGIAQAMAEQWGRSPRRNLVKQRIRLPIMEAEQP